MDKTYLGGDVYIEHDGRDLIVLTTELGDGLFSNRIILESAVLMRFLLYAQAFLARLKAADSLAEQVAYDVLANAEPMVILPPPDSIQGGR